MLFLSRIKERLASERGSVDIWIALTIAIIILLPTYYATSQVVQAARLRTILQQGANMVAQAEAAAGGYTQNVQRALTNYVTSNGLNPGRVYVSTTPGQQGYGQDNMNVVLGYDYDVVFPGTPWTIWHSYVQSGNPQIQSDYVPGAIDASITSPGGFTGTEGGKGNTNPPTPGPVTVVNSLTLSLSPSSAQAGQSVTVSGQVLEGSNPPPAGTIVNIAVNGAGISVSGSTDANGGYGASFTVKSAGTYTVTASCGIATASRQLGVTPAAASQIQLTAPQSVTVGNKLQIDGQVTDRFGNPVSGAVDVTSNDQADIPSGPPAGPLTAADGTFQMMVNEVTMSPLDSPLTVTFASGTASATASVSVLPGPPEGITLIPSATTVTAGQSVAFTGRVTSVADTPVASATDVAIGDSADSQDAFPVMVQTDQNGSYSTNPITMTLVGTQAVTAAVTENGQTVSAAANVVVSPAAPADVKDLTANPNPVFQGAQTTITGEVTDRYGNPVPGATITLNSSGFANPYTTLTTSAGTFDVGVVFSTSGTQTLSAEYNGQVLSPGGIQVTVEEQGAYLVTPQPASRSATAGQPVSVSFLVTSSVGSLVADAPVTFSASPAGSTSLSVASGTTNSNGLVSLTVTPESSGITSVTATVAGCGGTAKLDVSAAAPYQITSIQITPSFIQVNPSQSDWPVASGQVLDQYGNPVVGANITVSGGYGPQATGTTNANGVFSVGVDPISVGGPYYVTVQASDSLGSVTATSGTGLTVVQYPPATMEISLINPGQTIYTGQLIPVYCILYNQNMQLWSDAVVRFVSVTDQTAQISNLTPSGPAGSGTGSLQQDTGTYGNGEAAVNVNFDQSGSQTVLAELYINGNFTGTVAALTVTVLPGAVSQIAWNPVQPGTTVTAGTTLTVSGVALNSLGDPVPNGTQILVQLAWANSQTTYTTTGGRFQVSLSPTGKGSYWLQAVASGQTFNGVLMTIQPGPITYASPWGVNGSSNISETTINGIQYYTLNTPIPPGDNGITWTVHDQYWNAENDVPDNITITCTALSGGPAPFSSVQAPNPTGQQATINTPGYYFPVGQYQFTVANNATGKILSYYTITVANNALQPYEITDVTLTYGGNTYGPYYPNTPQYTNGTTLNVPAGTNVTMSGELVTQSGQPVPDWYQIYYAWGGTGTLEQTVSTDQNGRFSVSSIPYEAGSGSNWFNMWASTGSQSFNQPFNVTPAPVNQSGQITVTVNPPVIGEQSWWTQGISFNVRVAAFDQYGNPVTGSATLNTPVPAPNGSSPQVFSAVLSNGQATFSGIQNNVDANGTYPITVTVTDQYGDKLSKTAYITVN
ncbi:MAG: hypothetical protein M0Z41_05200 [Peptococcaceae bacterium]|nr:hypothetical protein [Peptococcaceae bacterium]